MKASIYNRANSTLVAALNTTDSNSYTRAANKLESTGKKLNEPGTGGVAVQDDHPAAASLVGGNCVRIYDDDDNHLTTFTITERRAVILAADDAAQIIVANGAGMLARWEESTIEPMIDGRPISLERVWNWATPSLDTSGWGAIYDRPGVDVNWDTLPTAYPISDVFVNFVWSDSTSETTTPYASQSAGTSLFRFPFTLSGDERMAFYVGGTRTWEVWVDGVLVDREPTKADSVEGYEETWRYVVDMTAGDHHFGMKCTSPGSGLSGVVACAIPVIGDVLDEVEWVSADSVTGWIAKHHPSTFPGYTAPQILAELLAEAQARGELTGWSIDVNGSHSELEEFSAGVGDTYLEVIDALCAADIDVEADDVGLVLHVYPKGSLGSSSGVSLVAGTNLSYLSKTTSDEFYNAVQGLWADGVAVRTNATSISSNGRRQTSVALGNVTNSRSVDAILDGYLDVYSEPTEALVAQMIPTSGAIAGVDFVIGDSVTVAGNAVRCVGLTWSLADDGEMVATPEFETVLSIRQREQRRAVDRQIQKYDSPKTAPILSNDTGITNGRIRTESVSWSWSGDIEESLDEDDPDKLWQPYNPKRTLRVWKWQVEINPEDLPDATGNSVFELYKNGALMNGLWNISLTTSVEKKSAEIWLINGTIADRFSPICSTTGNHVDGTVTMYLADPV